MLKAETFRSEKVERKPWRNSPVKARIATISAAIAVVALLSGCTSATEWWKAQARRQDAAARANVSTGGDIMADY
jgi:hypothetical protein